MINNELKSCPFCGGNAEIVSFNVFCDKAYYCKCTNCEAEIKAPSFSEQEAIESWNKRIANSIPFEIKQGEWLTSDVPESILAKCSICGFDCGAYSHNYCPNCGARMGVKKNDLA